VPNNRRDGFVSSCHLDPCYQLIRPQVEFADCTVLQEAVVTPQLGYVSQNIIVPSQLENLVLAARTAFQSQQSF
jgi:hypothetical protein